MPQVSVLALQGTRTKALSARPDAPILAWVRRRPSRVMRLARQVARWCPFRGSAQPSRVPAAAFADPGHELTAAQLWSVLTVAQLESGLALRAWLISPRTSRARSHRAYRAALGREERAARILAERARAESVAAEPSPA
jgi:hypothetical protein